MLQDASARPAGAQLENHKFITQSRAARRPNLQPDIHRAHLFLSAKAAAASEAFGLSVGSTVACGPPFPPLPDLSTPVLYTQKGA